MHPRESLPWQVLLCCHAPCSEAMMVKIRTLRTYSFLKPDLLLTDDSSRARAARHSFQATICSRPWIESILKGQLGPHRRIRHSRAILGSEYLLKFNVCRLELLEDVPCNPI